MARPLRYPERVSARVEIRVTPEQRRALDQVARETRSQVSGVIREAINEYVADYRERKVFCPYKTPR